MKRLILFGLLPLAGLLATETASGQTIVHGIECSSQDNRYHECALPFRGTAVITRQVSKTACIEGRSWGQRPGVVWVHRGCRAIFDIRSGGDGRNQNHSDSRIIVCASNKGERRHCNTGVRNRVRLVKQLKDSRTCIEGRTWGQSQGQVWVTAGCRAQFSSR